MTDINELLGRKSNATQQVPNEQANKPAFAFGIKPVGAAVASNNSVATTDAKTSEVAPVKTAGIAAPGNAPITENVVEQTQEVAAQQVEGVQAAPVSLIDAAQSLTLPTDSFNHPTQPSSFAMDQMVAIKNSIKVLADNIEDKNIVSDAIRNVLLTMMQNPETAELIEDGDIQMMTRGLRASYGQVLTVKQTRKKTTTAKSQRIDETLEKLKAFNF